MTDLEKFIEYRNKTLGKVKGVKGYHIFNNSVAEALVKRKPKSIKELCEVNGFSADGQRVKEYGTLIVDYFTKSNVFG